MKAFNKIPLAINLTICFFFILVSRAKAQEQVQVVLKGSTSTRTYESPMERVLRNQIAGIMGAIGDTANLFSRIGLEDEVENIAMGVGNLALMGNESFTSQDFTITYTSETMHMIGTIKPSTDHVFTSEQERNEYYEKNTMTMMLHFNPEGTQLDMMILVYGQQPFTMRVPHGNTIASSNRQSLLTPAPISNMAINGFDADKYNFYSEGELNVDAAVIPTPGGPTPIKLKKVERGEVWLAPDAPGIDLMRSFYLKLALGGYDLAGAEDGGIMALMDRLLDRGMPIRANEIMTVSSFDPDSNVADYLFKTVTDTNIISVVVEPIDEGLHSPSNNQQNPDSSSTTGSGSSTNPSNRSGSSPGSETDSDSSNTQNGPSTNPDNEGCDCSCEAYAKFVKLAEESKKGKKAKNKSGAELIKEINMSCMQDCIMQWTKCMKIKN